MNTGSVTYAFSPRSLPYMELHSGEKRGEAKIVVEIEPQFYHLMKSINLHDSRISVKHKQNLGKKIYTRAN